MHLLLVAVLWLLPELPPDILLVPGQLSRDRSPDGNSVLIRAPEGWIWVDSGRGGEHTDEVLRRIAESGTPLRAVINTHWHLDHIGGNADVRREWPDAAILAHPALDGALAGFHAANRNELEKLLPTLSDRPELKARLETELALLKLDRELAATELVAASGVKTLAGRTLELHVETRAVSDGDVWIVEPASNVLLAGDLVTLPVPLFDTACPEGWLEALSRIAETDFDVLVPGHGEPMDREGFVAYRRSFEELLACAASAAEDGACIEGWFRTTTVEDSPYGRELLSYYLKQFLRPEAPGRKRWCGA
jgi:glyoxylase-like metal-dependent hydrolase (beta-lactamase superfamily II)